MTSETALSAEEERDLRADLLAWQRAADGSDTKGILGFRLIDTALDALPRLLATLDAARSQPATEGLRERIEALVPPPSMRGERYRGWTEHKAAVLAVLADTEENE